MVSLIIRWLATQEKETSFRMLLERCLGHNSIEKFWLEKPLEFGLEIPSTKKMFKFG